MNDTFSPLEHWLITYMERTLDTQRRQIQQLEAQVAMLMEEREKMRSMLDVVEQLSAAEDSSPS